MGFTYGAIHRPVRGIGHAPAGFTGFGEHPDFKFGTVMYDEPLRREEQEHYSLVDLSMSSREIAKEIAAGMQEYAAEYIQEAEDSSRDFEIAVGQRIDRMNVHADRKVVAPLVLRCLKGERTAQGSSLEDVGFKKVTPHVARAPKIARKRAPRVSSFKPKGGEWIRIGSDRAVLHLNDHHGETWGITVDRDGSWRVREHPLSAQDDERAYTEGHVDEDLPSRERFTAAKKAARKYLADLLTTLSEEERR